MCIYLVTNVCLQSSHLILIIVVHVLTYNVDIMVPVLWESAVTQRPDMSVCAIKDTPAQTANRVTFSNINNTNSII